MKCSNLQGNINSTASIISLIPQFPKGKKGIGDFKELPEYDNSIMNENS